ncbi:MAG: DUF6504 family protein [Streptosporangiales bacterium]
MQDGVPARFAWRGRLYTVRGVLDHWMTSHEWWRQQAPDLDAPAEREFWRVEASPGGDARAGVYELRRDPATGHWMLARIWDLTKPAGPATSFTCTWPRPTHCGTGSPARPPWRREPPSTGCGPSP